MLVEIEKEEGMVTPPPGCVWFLFVHADDNRGQPTSLHLCTTAAAAAGPPCLHTDLDQPPAESIKQLAACTSAVFLTLQQEQVLIAAYRQQAMSANPHAFSRKEDNRGLHPGGEGWMQCREPGAPEADEQTAREALHEAAERMLLRAVEFRSVLFSEGARVH
jgi:hypothetical protein